MVVETTRKWKNGNHVIFKIVSYTVAYHTICCRPRIRRKSNFTICLSDISLPNCCLIYTNLFDIAILAKTVTMVIMIIRHISSSLVIVSINPLICFLKLALIADSRCMCLQSAIKVRWCNNCFVLFWIGLFFSSIQNCLYNGHSYFMKNSKHDYHLKSFAIFSHFMFYFS